MNVIEGTDKAYSISQSDCYYTMLWRVENNESRLDIDDIQNNRGVYIFWNWDDKPIRIGKAVKVRNRLLSYANNTSNWNVFDKMQDDGIQYVSVIYTDNETESAVIELDLLAKHRPKHNKVNV